MEVKKFQEINKNPKILDLLKCENPQKKILFEKNPKILKFQLCESLKISENKKNPKILDLHKCENLGKIFCFEKIQKSFNSIVWKFENLIKRKKSKNLWSLREFVIFTFYLSIEEFGKIQKSIPVKDILEILGVIFFS